MNRKTSWRLGMAFPLVLACIGLTDCGGNATTTVPPTAIALLRYGGASGAPDATFGGGDGIVVTDFETTQNDYALAVALQPAALPADVKIVVVGSSFRTIALNTVQGQIAVLRYAIDGTPDSTFGTGGVVRTAVGTDSAEAVAVAVQPDGKIVVAGTILAANFSGKGIVLLRYMPDGTLDTTFGASGTTPGIVIKTIGTGADTAAAALALQPAALLADVKIIVAGHALTSAKTDIVLLRYNLDGTPDSGFGSSGIVTTPLVSDAAALAIQLQPADNKIVAAGSVGNFSNSSMDSVLLRYNTDGTLDTTFGVNGIVITGIGGGNDFANALVLQPDRKIVVAGHANVNFSADTSDIALLRYDEFGALETTFGLPAQAGKVVTTLGGFDNAFSVALQSDLKIVVSGNTGSAGSAVRVAVLRFDASGVLDPTFGTGGLVTTQATGPSTVASGNAVLVQPDGSIVVAGYD